MSFVPLPMECRAWSARISRSKKKITRATTRGLIAAAALAGFLQACSGDNLLLPSAGQPAKITVQSGDGQSATVGHALDQPIVVLVTDPENRPVEGIQVAFDPPAGAEITPNDTVVTGPDGTAAINYTLSTVSGDQSIIAKAKPVVATTTLSTTITATAKPGTAVQLTSASSRDQKAQVSTALPESLAVRVVDQFGNGVPDIEVAWDADGGEISAISVPTNSDGRSAVQRVMGDRPGSYPTTASVSGLDGSPVSFTATAVAAPSPALTLVTQPSSTASAGVAFDQQPELQLQDASGAPLAQADVRVTAGIGDGGGSLGGTTSVRSDGDGRVKFSDLSIRGRPGSRTLIFAAEGFSPVASNSIEVSAGPASADQSSASVPDGRAGSSTKISIRLEDEFGTRLEGAAGAVVVSVSGANSAGNLAATDEGDGSYSASYTPTHAGTDQIDVTVNGSRVDHSPFESKVVPGPASPATTTAEFTRSGFPFIRVDVVVTTRDAQGNLLGKGGDALAIQLGPDNERDLIDNGDGTYSFSFLTFGSVGDVGITLNGEPIAGSPFNP
jgi:Bacterial Ig-like domain (group 1)/Filamin/ABP280 repeat